MALGPTPLLQHPAHAGVHRAALVIEHGSGRLVTRCVSFVENQITGLQLIMRSGASYESQGFGSLGEAICQLDGEPAVIPPHCFGAGPYWQYFHGRSGAWTNSGTGAGGWILHDGDMDGWRYAVGAAQVPPALAFSQVCAPLASQPAPTVPASAIATSPPTRPPASPATSSPSASLTVTPPSSTATPASSPRAPASATTQALSVLAGSLLLLAALTAWNLFRRGP